MFAGQASAAAPACADLQPTFISVSPASPIAGEPATIAITVHNGGSCAAGAFVTQFRTSLLSPTGPSFSLDGLDAGATATVIVPFSFPKAGNFKTVVEVDTGKAVSETNESNNLEIKPITVQAREVTLGITGFIVEPTTFDPTGAIVQGRVARATIDFANSGNVASGPFTVSWTPEPFAKPLTQIVDSLNAGESGSVQFEYTFPMAGTFNGTATIGKAKATHSTVVEAPLPNLTVQGPIAVDAGLAGSPTTIEVPVSNNGNGPAGPFVVQWKPSSSGAVQAVQVAGLGEGETTTVPLTFVFPSAGTFSGTVTLDSTHKVTELNEKDNTASTSVTVAPATVDLVITNLTINPSSPTQGSPATATVTIKNQGASPSGETVTDWNPEATGTSISGPQTLSRQTPSINPGEEREVTFSFAYPKPGDFRSIAEVNAFNSIKETNTANNQAILNLTVQPQPIKLVFSGPIKISGQAVEFTKATTATLKVLNEGPLATGPFQVKLVPVEEEGKEGTAKTQFVSGLNPGESRTLSYSVLFTHHGTFEVKATLDPAEQVVLAEPRPVQLTETVEVEKCTIKFIC